MFGRVVTKVNEVKCQKWESGKVENFDEAKELFLDAAKILRRRAESVEADVSGLSPRVLQFQRGNPWYATDEEVDKLRQERHPEVCGCRDNGVLRCKGTKYF